MAVRYIFVNPDEMVDLDLSISSTEYTTEVISAEWDTRGDLIIKLRFLGEKFDRNNPTCLFPVSVNSVSVDSDTPA